MFSKFAVVWGKDIVTKITASYVVAHQQLMQDQYKSYRAVVGKLGFVSRMRLADK